MGLKLQGGCGGQKLSFDIYYSTERTGAPRDMAEGYSDTGRAQWDVSQWDVSTRGATEFIFPVSGGCDISSGNGHTPICFTSIT